MRNFGIVLVTTLTTLAAACVSIDEADRDESNLDLIETTPEDEIEEDDTVVSALLESQGVTVITTRTLLPDSRVEYHNLISGPRTVAGTCGEVQVDAGVILYTAPDGTVTKEAAWNDSSLDGSQLALLGADLGALIARDENAGPGGSDEDPSLEIDDDPQCAGGLEPVVYLARTDKTKVEKGKKASEGNNQDPCYTEVVEYNSALSQFRISVGAVIGTLPLGLEGVPEGIFVVAIGLAANVEEKRKKLTACCAKSPNSTNCKDVIKF